MHLGKEEVSQFYRVINASFLKVIPTPPKSLLAKDTPYLDLVHGIFLATKWEEFFVSCYKTGLCSNQFEYYIS